MKGCLRIFRAQLLITCSKGRSKESNSKLKSVDLMAAAADLEEIEEVIQDCILMAHFSKASTSGYVTPEEHISRATRNPFLNHTRTTENDRVDNTAKTRRPHPRSNTKNDRVPLRLRVVATRLKKLK
ncbi:hypothetical protein Tco_1121046 [Tanacetum coccineum]|uniref:Uncharacterized protein n=1 Tax=Tanacetum coccineum TaxID=301880 RepID=A0ABQ5IWJ3_9ASTR